MNHAFACVIDDLFFAYFWKNSRFLWKNILLVTLYFLQCDLLGLLYFCFLFLFLLGSFVCSIDRLYGMQLICALVAHVCVSRHLVLFSAVIVSFLKRIEFSFCDLSLDFCRSKVCWILYVVFHLSIFLNDRYLNFFVPGWSFFIFVKLFKIFHQVWEFFVVCWQFIFSRGSVVLQIGNCFFVGVVA